MSRLVVLASTSPFRRELLARLQLPFETVAPETDESALPGEAPASTALRLSEAKARAVARRFPDALIIGSDQVAAQGNDRFGKPGSRQNAIAQLRLMRGKEVVFHTGLCLLNSATNRVQTCCIDTHVGFRDLADAEIESYLDKEDALNCAGSARSEGLGISLLSYLRGDDPNALIGLPLIALCDMLRAEGLRLP
ncbi:Maf family protein [Sulfuritalea hydrogenivorans]|jgi:septum formation protein|uniref:7-methyl-GTP pyrophosphatase n=1 Tax=Sulfuritalea hydrogenivorans sk43H TaxID=1223802 RepID=W0SG42_9PROT|nr:Maf family nucleotide pyrophosphatase [Sulfuritalea hydrogenivorans]BAO29996.1 maf protein [Sulfuritalea hydrogenivorans sk43H]